MKLPFFLSDLERSPRMVYVVNFIIMQYQNALDNNLRQFRNTEFLPRLSRQLFRFNNNHI